MSPSAGGNRPVEQNVLIGLLRWIYKNLSKLSKPGILVTSIGTIVLLGLIDYFTGFELSFSIFYIVPISMVAWFISRKTGLLISFASAITWQVANIIAGEDFSSAFIPLWNAATRLGLFVVVTLLMSELRVAVDHERELSRTDFLTGALNSRAFYEIAESEIRRYYRYRKPFTLIYIDLDNFKFINDQFGHNIGDLLLQSVVGTIKKSIRATDMIARLGGDEFAVVLLETDQEIVRGILSRMQESLRNEMQLHQWPMTFSMGVLCCPDPPSSVNEMIRQADQLMYQVKNNGKNGVVYSSYANPYPLTPPPLPLPRDRGRGK
jgi:diguanylate cyclase (GGDEF)-like protein